MTKSKLIILTMLVMFNINQIKAQYGTGDVYNPKARKGVEFVPSSLGYSAENPSSYSLKKYAPYAKNQGIYGSCAGWAVSYEALSIQYAISNGLTSRNHITAKAFDPYYSYNKDHGDDPDCSKGAWFGSMMSVVMEEGAKKYYLPLMGCGSSVTDEFGYASKYYKIKNWYTLKNVWPQEVVLDVNDLAGSYKKFFNAPHRIELKDVKTVLANNIPLVISILLPTSFYNAGELWEPTAAEKADPYASVMDNTGGHRSHAMTVIGYDDTKYGGAFEVMNSWSESWGKDGFFWVKYADFKMFVKEAGFMEMFPADADIATRKGVVWGDCLNGYGFYRGDNGEAYEGQFKNGTFHGYGIYTWPNGQAYAGQWVNGKREGEATFYFVGGTFGQATYSNDVFVSGYDEWTFKNGDTYKGNIKDDKFDGYGEYTFANGEKYIGMFSNGALNGLTKYFGTDGSTYLGFYSDGKRNGKGLAVSGSGKVSAGDWLYGVYQSGKNFGFATGNNANAKSNAEMTSNMYLSADCESGNCLIGEGRRKTPDGRTYSGTFVDGLEDGLGKMVFTDGVFTGTFKQGQKQGIGQFAFNAGGAQISEFKNDRQDGYVLEYDNIGNMWVYLVKEGVLINEIKENNTTSAVASKSLPSSNTVVPEKIISIRKK